MVPYPIFKIFSYEATRFVLIWDAGNGISFVYKVNSQQIRRFYVYMYGCVLYMHCTRISKNDKHDIHLVPLLIWIRRILDMVPSTMNGALSFLDSKKIIIDTDD